MPMVNVSEKTLSELKEIKDEEEFKSLDGTIRYLFNKSPSPIEMESMGPWPENALDDVNKLRIKILETSLQSDYDLCKNVGLYASTPTLDTRLNIPTLYLAETISKSLDYRLGKTEITYRKAIENNDLAKIIEVENMQSGSAVMMFGHIIAIMKNIEISKDKPCGFCPNMMGLHREAVKLGDGRLVCYECYTKVFDSVLSEFI